MFLRSSRRIGPTVAVLLVAGSLQAAGVDRVEERGLLKDGFLTELDLLVGVRMLEDDEWEAGATDQLLGAGLQYQTRPLRWPVGIQLSFTHTQGDDDPGGGSVDIAANELLVGVNYPLEFGRLFTFEIAGGGGLSHMKIDTPQTEETVSSLVGYAQAGLRVHVDNVDFSAFGRYIYGVADVDVLGDDLNPGGLGIFGGVGVRF